MFKNLTAFRIQGNWHPDLPQATAALEKFRFAECGASQAISAGWVAPRGDKHAPLLESVGNQWMLSLCIQTKILPAGVIKAEVERTVAKIRDREGRKPGKKEMREIKEGVIHELLPKAFSKKEILSIWIDRKNALVVIDTASASKSDSVTTCLVRTFNGLAINLIQTEQSPAACMSHWLMEDEPPAHFSVDSECELKSSDERRSAVKYSRHELGIDEIKQHIEGGKQPTQLAMTWDGRVSFVLTEAMGLKKVTFLETPLMKKKGEDEVFDANAAIVTGELSQLIPHLIEALGGELKLGESEGSSAGAEERESELEAA